MDVFPKLISLLVIGCSMLFPRTSPAEFHGAITATTDYVWRGFSKSDNDVALQANLDYEHASGFFVGATASSIDFGDKHFKDHSEVEIIPYLGWSYNINNDWRADFQWSRYFYDGKLYGIYSDYNEFYFFLHYKDLLTARASFSEDYYHRGHAAGDFELTGRYPLTDWLQISAGSGYSLTKDAIEYDYLYWNAGVTLFTKYVVFDLRYMDAYEADETVADHHDGPAEVYPDTLDATVVFSISVGF